VISLQRDHHWLPIAKQIEYKLCTLVYRCLHGNATWYLADHAALTSSSIEGEACDLRILSLWKCRELGYRLATYLSMSQAPTPRTLLPKMFALPSQCTLLEIFKNVSIRVLTLSGVLIAFFAYLNFREPKFVFFTLHYITIAFVIIIVIIIIL